MALLTGHVFLGVCPPSGFRGSRNSGRVVDVNAAGETLDSMSNGEHTERIVRAETRLEDVRDDIADLKGTVEGLDPSLGRKADNLVADFHKLELRLASLEARIMTWGSALMALVVIAGVIVPVVMSLTS